MDIFWTLGFQIWHHLLFKEHATLENIFIEQTAKVNS